MRLAYEAASLGVQDYDLVTGCIHWDARTRSIWGVGPEESITYDLVLAGLHPDDRAPTEAALALALDPAGDGRLVAECRVINRLDGVARWVSVTATVFFEQGRAVRLIGAVQDTTARKSAEEAQRRSEAALQASEQRYATLFSNHTDGIVHCRTISDEHDETVDYEIVRVNNGYESITGIKSEDVEGTTPCAASPAIENLPFDYVGTFGRIARDGGEVRFENYVAPRDQWLSIHAYSPLPGEFTAILTDITDRKRAESALCESEKQIRITIESIGDGFFAIDGDWRFVYVNATAERLLGIARDLLIGKNHWDVFPLTLGTELERRYRLAAAGEPQDWENYYTPWDRWFHNRCFPRQGGGMSVYFQDITERKRTDETLRQNEARERERASELATLFDAVPMPVFVAQDPECLHVAGNRAADELLKNRPGSEVALTSPPDRRPRHFLAVKDGRTIEIHELPIRRAAEGVHVRDYDFDIVFDDGSVRNVVAYGSPLRDQDGRPRGAVCVLVDVTERKRVEAELRSLNRTLKALRRSSRAMLSAKTEREYLDAVCEIVVEDCGHSICWIGFAEDDESKSIRRIASAGLEEGYSKLLQLTWAEDLRGRGPAGRAVRTGKPAWCAETLTDPNFVPWREEALKRGLRSVLAVPLIGPERPLGLIVLYARTPGAFSPADVNLYMELADDVTRGIMMLRARQDRARAEEALHKSEALLRTVCDNIPDPIFVKDRESRLILANPATLAAFGKPEADVLGRTDVELYADPAAGAAIVEADRRIMARGETEVIEETIPTPTGVRLYLSTKTPLRDAAGRTTGIVGVARDITDRKRADEALRESEARLRLALDIGAIGTFELDVAANTVIYGPAAQRIMGVSEAAVPLTEIQRRYHPEDRDRVAEAIARSRDPNLRELYALEFRVVWEDGTIRWAAVRGAYTFDDTRNPPVPIYAHGVMIDITDRKRGDQALRESDERFRLALRNAPVTVSAQDRNLRYIWAYNHRTRTTAEIVGKTDEDLFTSDVVQRVVLLKRHAMETGQEAHDQLWVTSNGQRLFLDLYVEPLRDEAGGIIGVALTTVDLTRIKLAEEERARHLREIEVLNARLQRAMSETHHRVKNNLQVIGALLEMRSDAFEKAIEADDARSLGYHVRGLSAMHDLLTQEAKMGRSVDTLSLRATFDKLLPLLQATLDGRRIRSEIADARITTRQAGALAILLNEAVSNATKYAPGDLGVRACISDETVLITVEDDGPGFPKGFDPVRSANTGIELIMQLARHDLGGTVVFENGPEGGARVVVEFPLRAAPG